MEQFVLALRKEVEDGLLEIEKREVCILCKSQDAIALLENAFNRLKAFITTYEFGSDAGEIHFFREVKPRLFCNLIYHRKVYNMEMNRPTGSEEVQVEYLHKQQARIKDFFDKNLDFYKYYRSGSTHLDEYYFKRGVQDTFLNPESFYFERDPLFSTGCDFKVAKILANERFEVYLKSAFDELQQDKVPRIPELPKEKHTWTSGKIDLIEIIYAFEALGCTNHGKVTLKDMSSYAEFMLNIDLGNVSRGFYDLCIRTNPTQFLDRLRNALKKRVDDINGSTRKRK